MSANIEFNEKKQTYSFVANAGKERKELAWHRLGQYFDRPLSVEEAIQGCNADYNVGKGKLIHVTNDIIDAIRNGQPLTPDMLASIGSKDIIESHVCTYREDTGNVLGVVGKGYEVVQNVKAFEFINELTGIGSENNLANAVIETAGILGSGERIFITAKMPENIRIGNSKDIIKDYILFTNSHDGTGAVIACFTPVRVVCNNTLNAALKNCSNRLYFRHTKNVHNKLAQAQKLMNLHTAYVENLGGRLVELSQERVNDKEVKELIAKTFLNDDQLKLYQKANNNWEIDEIGTRTKNVCNEVLKTMYEGTGQNMYEGTKLWVYNGITCYNGNAASYTSDVKKFDALNEGVAYKKQQAMFDLLAI